MASPVPLGSVDTVHLQQLAQILWDWYICADCLSGNSCERTAQVCAWPRSKTLSRYFQYYKHLTLIYMRNIETHYQTSAITSNEDLIKIIQQLKVNPAVSKTILLHRIFKNGPICDDQERALNLAVHVMVMVNCSASRRSYVLLEHGAHQSSWHADATFSQFLCDAFPQSDYPNVEEIKEDLRAVKLKKHARLTFIPTDDLRNHLRLDRKAATPQNISASDPLKLGALPRQLALEVLDSIQKVLFPLTDSKSKKLLLSLTSTLTCNFDTDVIRYDSVSIRNPDEHSIHYRYFGARLAELHEELMNPTPRGFEKWFERNSRARSVMMATIAGVIFAIILGILGLGVASFQAWVSYMAWKHPVTPSTGQ